MIGFTNDRFGKWVWPVAIVLVLVACQKNSLAPPPAFLSITTFYKTPGGANLLDDGTANSFKKENIKVVSDIEFNGQLKETIYDFGGVTFDSTTGNTCLEITVPTNYQRTPLRTRVTLAPNLTDTLTYTYEQTAYQYCPDKIFYNKKLVWDIRDTKSDGKWPTITIIK